MADMQFGGWYQNPATKQTQRYWGNNVWTSGEDPTGGRGVNWQQSQTSSPANTAMSMTQSQPTDYASIYKQALDMQRQANQPIIQSLEAQKPNIETQYQNLLKDITKYSTKATASEFSRRGIPLSSGVYEQNLAEAIEPRIAQAGETRSNALSSLAQQIAQLESGAMGNAASTALNLYQMANQQPDTEVVTAGGRKLLVNKATGETISDLGASSEGGSGGSALDPLTLSILGKALGMEVPGQTSDASMGMGVSEPKPTTNPGPVSMASPGKQWMWDYSSQDWIPIID